MPTVGVLALQGNFAEHISLLGNMKISAREVRTIADLQDCTHLILPGGESTTIRNLLRRAGLDSEIVRRAKDGSLALLGVCAGAILLSAKIEGKNAPDPLGVLDITINRNAYGSQLDSFADSLTIEGVPEPVSVSFIRAPKITHTGANVIVLAEHEGSPVVVRQDRIWAISCHPELRGETALHTLFLES